jgi:hypothetical protein
VTADEEGSKTAVAAVASGTASDPNPANNTAAVTTVVSDPAVVLAARGFSATEFQALNDITVATFTHGNGAEPAGGFSAAINWGDGTTSSGTVTRQGTSYVVQGSHTYASDGNHTVTVSVTDGSTLAEASATANVAEGGQPGGSSGPLADFIFETIDDIFGRALSSSQLRGLSLALLALDLSAAAKLQQRNGNALESLAIALTRGQMELPLLATVLHNNGTSLESAVNDMVTGMLLQSLAQLPGLRGS